MCGITGVIGFDHWSFEKATHELSKMSNAIKHRGPDDTGLWIDKEAEVALGHRRLSIIDLSPAGHQPMVSADGRYVLVFNGEIYNHPQIRNNVEKGGLYNWKGHSDTEVLLARVGQVGLKVALQESRGMFALALWDKREKCLLLARDRMGEKPLFYGWQNKRFFFASELKSLMASEGFNFEKNKGVLPYFLKYGFVPSPYSIWKDIFKLEPGYIIQISPKEKKIIRKEPYWDIDEEVEKGLENRFEGSLTEATKELDKLLKDVVSGQLMGDVPVGAFLSGGIDSSLVVAIMQKVSSSSVKTFTIGFDVERYNEAVFAKEIAAHLGTEHYEMYVDARKAREVIPKLSSFFDEPFGDSSAIPTYLVSEFAKTKVTVSLSGDGGDELFGGYGRYNLNFYYRFWSWVNELPEYGKKVMLSILSTKLPDKLDRIHDFVIRHLSKKNAGFLIGPRIEKLHQIASGKDVLEYYDLFVSQWANLPARVSSEDLSLPILSPESYKNMTQPQDIMMLYDTKSYLPDDILTKVDRTSMAVSLEARAPLLDHRIIEFAWSLPFSYKIQGGTGKNILRQLLYNYVPKKLLDRPKSGFSVPVDEWIRGPLREWADYLLSKEMLERDGLFLTEIIQNRYKQHISGQKSWRDSLWGILMWQAWSDRIN